MPKTTKQKYLAAISYGKDSLAMLEIIKKYHMPLDKIVHVEIMATPNLRADLPPMVEFKAKADKIIQKRYGIEVEHVTSKLSFEEYFYQRISKGQWAGRIHGFPTRKCSWCVFQLKTSPLRKLRQKFHTYLGIASDEPERRHTLNEFTSSPLLEHGVTEIEARKICEELGLLSPIYQTTYRSGCWFCVQQSIGQLRNLRKNYPQYWEKLLQWDRDSPVTFLKDGITVRMLDKRFELEDAKKIPNDSRFRWKMLKNF